MKKSKPDMVRGEENRVFKWLKEYGLWTVEDAAAECGCARQTIHNLIASGEVRAVVVPVRQRNGVGRDQGRHSRVRAVLLLDPEVKRLKKARAATS